MKPNDDFNEYRQKGLTFTQNALKKLQEGDIESSKKDWEDAKRYLDLFYQHVNSEVGEMQMMYGEGLNFGVIMDVIFENSDRLYNGGKDGKKIIRRLINEIKSDKVLRKQFDVYNCFTDKKVWENRDIKETKNYVDEVAAACHKLNENTIFDHNRKLIELIKKGKLDENVMIDSDKMKLYEAIECLIVNKNSLSKVIDMAEAKQSISNYLSENMIKATKTNLNYEDRLAEITEKYNNELNEDEIKLIRDVTTNENKAKRLFAENQARAIELVQREIDKGEDTDSWKSILESISGKTFNKNTALTDIAEFIEMTNELED